MSLKYLLDENVNPIYATQLRRLKPDLVIRVIGEPVTPCKGTLDPEILYWCEDNDFILGTNNRTSMPVHLADYLENYRHIPGIFILNPNLSIRENIEELILAAEASFDNEYQDQINYLPFP
jgi:Domain of unknown function (DUF5615)